MSHLHVSDMSKEQAREYLRILGEEAHPRWTSLEIKFRIGELEEIEFARPKNLGLMVRRILETPEWPEPDDPIRSRPDETIVGFGRYADKMYKEVPQQYLDWVMEVAREVPTECAERLSRLAAWARNQRGSSSEEGLQHSSSTASADEPIDVQPACGICRHQTEMV